MTAPDHDPGNGGATMTTTAETPRVEPTAPDATHAQVEVIPPQQRQEPFDLAGPVPHDEFVALAAQARLLHMSGAAPKAIREDIYVAFHVAMAGRDYGISPTAAMDLIDVIWTSKGPQLSPSPQLINGQIERLGLGKVVPFIRTQERCVAVALEPGGRTDVRCRPTWPEHRPDGCVCAGVIGDSEFVWADAQIAGLVLPDCRPGVHTPACKGRDGKSCNTGYVNYPQRMMWWRAAGFCADDWFPQASLGRYSPEALGAIIDADGRAVDPASAPVPPGYEPPPTAAERAAAEEADPEVKARLDAERHALQERAHALPDEQRRLLAERWRENTNLAEYRMDNLPRAKFKLVGALIGGFESAAKKDGWDPEAARAAQGAQEPPGAPTPSAGPDRPQEPQQAPDPPESEAAVPPLDRIADVRGSIDVNLTKPAGKGQLREVNIILTGYGHAGDARYAVLEAVFGRPFTSSSGLSHGEAKALIETTPRAPKQPPDTSEIAPDGLPAHPEFDVDPDPVGEVIERVKAMTDDEVVEALGAEGLPVVGNARVRLAEHLAGPLVKDVP